jgi:hypothetical protein
MGPLLHLAHKVIGINSTSFVQFFTPFHPTFPFKGRKKTTTTTTKDKRYMMWMDIMDISVVRLFEFSRTFSFDSLTKFRINELSVQVIPKPLKNL